MKRHQKIIRMTALLSALFGTIVRIGLSVSQPGGIDVFLFFTIQSNLMVCLFLGIEVWRWIQSRGSNIRTFHTGVHAAVMLYIAITGIVYNTLLLPLVDFSGMNLVIATINHTVTPLLFFIDWLANQERKKLQFRHIGLWLIYPIIYGICGTIEGNVTGRFRYIFLDYPVLGWPKYALMMSFVTATFLILGSVLIGINRAGKKKTAEVKS